MEKLLILDLKNYTDDMPVCEKYAVRAVIIKQGKLAMQISKLGEYKIPGGGVEESENFESALIREVKEETGLLVERDSIIELGEIQEIREDNYKKGQKYICHSYYYTCKVKDETVAAQMTENEKEKGYQFIWQFPEIICRTNEQIQKEAWTIRDTEFIKMFINGKVKLGA